MNKLSQRHENYAQLLYKGIKQIVAYGEAGFSTSGLPETTAANASRLANSDKIVARLAELNAPIVEMIQSKKEQKLKILEDIYNEKPQAESITAHAVIGAITEHNKMEHIYDEAPYQDNRVVNYYFPTEEAKKLTENISKRLLDTPESKSEPLNDDDNV